VGHAGDADVHVHVEVLVEDVVLRQAYVIQNAFQLLVEALRLVVIGGSIDQADIAVRCDRRPVLRHPKVFGGEPEGRRRRAPAPVPITITSDCSATVPPRFVAWPDAIHVDRPGGWPDHPKWMISAPQSGHGP
jgi:hypothetical protein